MMTTKSLGRVSNIIVVSSASDFADIVCLSNSAFSAGLHIIPVQCEEEARLALSDAGNCLFVIHPEHRICNQQNRIIAQGIVSGARWCSLKTYKRHLIGFAEIESVGDLLEWLEPVNFQIDSVIRQKLMCLLRRLTAVAALTFALPLLTAVAAAIWIADGRPIFFRQVRVGFRGKPFKLLKFRTMKNDAEKDGPQWSSGTGDPRAFPLGRFLRRTHLDELPQLWNVICGDLCIIGPRPERPEFHDILKSQIPHFDARTRVKPGITGWAQIYSGYASTIEESKEKFSHDVFFIRNSHWTLHLKIIFKTIQKVIREVMSAAFRTANGHKSKTN
ncbi:MAG: sugar transferase [Proteobacteria bacterium]|nr:sugar transferase [Pseudomonadota bacterium]